MSRRGNCWDNAVAESFFATLKIELAHDADWATRAQARGDVFAYIEGFYNGARRHSALGYLSPLMFERYWVAAGSTAAPTASRPSEAGVEDKPSSVMPQRAPLARGAAISVSPHALSIALGLRGPGIIEPAAPASLSSTVRCLITP